MAAVLSDLFDPLLLGQALISGVLLGLIYSLMAVGLSLTMGIMGIVNVAHSVFVLLGAFATYQLWESFGLNPLLAIPVVFLFFFAVGVLLQRFLIRRVQDESQSTGLLILFGVLVAVESLTILAWTTDTRVLSADYGPSIFIGDFIIGRSRLVAGIISLVLVAALHLLLTRTRWGKGVRAMSQDHQSATLMGINTERMAGIVFGLGTATAAVGGLGLALVFPFTPQGHIRWLAWAFLVVVVGGLGSVRATLFAGLFVGVLETTSGVVLPFELVSTVVFTVLALALVLRGEGLAGVQRRSI